MFFSYYILYKNKSTLLLFFAVLSFLNANGHICFNYPISFLHRAKSPNRVHKQECLKGKDAWASVDLILGLIQPNTSPLGHAASHLRVGVSAVLDVFVGMPVWVWVCGCGCGGVGGEWVYRWGRVVPGSLALRVMCGCVSVWMWVWVGVGVWVEWGLLASLI